MHKKYAKSLCTQQGFTLIELMIVIAIIGILAAVAIPLYNNYGYKSRMVNIVTAVSAAKAGLNVCVQTRGGGDTNCKAGGDNEVPADVDVGSNTVAVATSWTDDNNVVIKATPNTESPLNEVDGFNYQLKGEVTAGTIVWKVVCNPEIICP